MLSSYLLLLLLLLLKQAVVENSVATSTHDMARVLQGENDLLTDLRLYVAALERKVKITRLILDDAIKRQQEARVDAEAYVANPLNSLPLVRRMHMDAGRILKCMKLEPGADLQKISDYRLDVISEADQEEAIKGLLRIQQVYELDERHMVHGQLSQKQYNAKLSTLDCVAVARHLRKRGEDEQAIRWLELALEQYPGTPERVYQLLKIDRTEILRELAHIQISRDNWPAAGSTYEQVLEHATRAQDKKEALAAIAAAKQHLMHLRLCRGQSPPLVSSSLRCRLNTATTPFLRLAPLKLEQLSLDPYVVLYHDVVQANEREDIMRLTKPYLRRARVGAGRAAAQRFAMNAGYSYNKSRRGERLRQRLEDMSGFDLTNSGQLAVLNYGIGGQYYMHFDCWFDQDDAAHRVFIKDNRIATILLYLTDVQLGGLTSFPVLGLAVKPSKGSALIWHNMNNAAECDRRTLHAACPLLLGTRWVASQWIDMNGQWRTKRCLANPSN
ncbi:prolyl 4-hydroxylase subunit alpha-2 [Drosophila montana]|uniref:prolyl 4-hydroxylase subunit alpha-2 n=1 Tax=Drosophila montana TaxID=40370 RepID=UPI00313A81B0